MVRVTATASPQIQRSKSRTFVLERAKNTRKFKRRNAEHLVRDEEVAGSAAFCSVVTPTIIPIANIDVKDPAKFEEYRRNVVPVIEKFGGRYLIRGGDVRRPEGNLPLKRVVVLEFPTVEAAQQF